MIKKKKAFSLIELIVTILVLIIIGSMTVAFFTPMINLFFYSPSQLMVDQTAQEILTILIDGDHKSEGLRSVKSITSANEDTITFTTWDDNTIIYRWDSSTDRIYRKINSQAEALIPSSYYGDITVKGQSSDSEIFQYYTSTPLNGTPTKLSVPVSSVTSIESIRMDLTVQAGSGDVGEYKGIISVKAGVDIKQFS